MGSRPSETARVADGHDVAPSLPLAFHVWLGESTDLALSRALVEDEHAFRPEALERLREELRRRGADPDLVMRAFPRPRRPGRRRRALYGGLVLASLGLVPALVPRWRSVDVTLLLDNPGRESIRVLAGNQGAIVPPHSLLRLHVQSPHREIPLLGWLRAWRGESGEVRLPLSVHLWDPGGSPLGSRALAWVPEGRMLLSLADGPPLRLEARTYRLEGRRALPEGPIEGWLLPDRRDGWDLDRFPGPDGEPVTVQGVNEPFPAALEMPSMAGGERRRVYRLVRE